MNLLCAMVIAFSMYSKIPMPRLDWTKERMRYMFCFFPLIGAAIGLLMWLWCRFGGLLVGNGNLFAAILVLIPIAVTGGIHMDGFLDTTDALSSYKPLEEKLEILKDSHAGAFAILMGCCYFVLDFGVYSQADEKMMRTLAIGFVLSRALSGLAVVTFRMAKNTGLASTFSDMAQKNTVKLCMLLYIGACAVLMLLAGKAVGAVCFAAALLVFLWYRHLSYKQFGGITGDLAGFFLQVCELAMALAVVIASRFL